MDQVLNRIDHSQLLDLLQNLVQRPSVTPGDNAEAEVAQYISDWAERSGLEVEVDMVLPGRPNVYAWVRGRERRPCLVFNGHTDVVPAGEGWSHPPFGAEVVGDRLYGRGSCDMKSGLAAMLIAAKAIKESGVTLEGDLAVTAVIDEEWACTGTPRALKRGITGDFAIVGEPTSLAAVIASKGDVNVEIRAFGRAAHSSRPEEGVNAIYKMMQIVSAIETKYAKQLKVKYHHLLGSPTVSVDTIEGGATPWIIPESCKIVVDRRTLPGEDAALVMREIEVLLQSLKQREPDLKVETSLRFDASSGGEIAADEPIVKAVVSSAERVLGKSVAIRGMSGTSDARYLIGDGKMPTVIFGPGDSAEAHKPDESVSLTEVFQAAQIYALVVVKLLGNH